MVFVLYTQNCSPTKDFMKMVAILILLSTCLLYKGQSKCGIIFFKLTMAKFRKSNAKE